MRVVAVVASALVLGAEAGWLAKVLSEARNARAMVMARTNEIARLQSLDPAPNADVEAQLRERRVQLETASAGAAEVRDAPDGAAVLEEVEELEPADAYFRLATYVDDLRERALSAGIVVGTNERFGFSEYANVGPPAELVPLVLRQSAVFRRVIDPLIALGPVEISRVQRARPEKEAGADAPRDQGTALRDSADYFEFGRDWTVESLSAREMVFRVEFVGRASLLRTLLNHYAAADSAVVVRQVEIARLERARRKGGEQDEAADERLVVDEALCRFSMVTEVSDAAKSFILREIAGGMSDLPWEEPVGQSSGAAWRFELFSPPRVFRDDSGGYTAEGKSDLALHMAAADTNGPFGLTLLSLETEFFRLQLVGFTGEREQAMGLFENVETGEMLLARAGQRLAGLSATIEELDVQFSDVAVLDG